MVCSMQPDGDTIGSATPTVLTRQGQHLPVWMYHNTVSPGISCVPVSSWSLTTEVSRGQENKIEDNGKDSFDLVWDLTSNAYGYQHD